MAKVFSGDRLEVNASTTFVELALAAADAWSKENQQASKRERGGVAPYRIRNQTGVNLQIWSDQENVTQNPTTLISGEEVDWRFDDWKSLREVCPAIGTRGQS